MTGRVKRRRVDGSEIYMPIIGEAADYAEDLRAEIERLESALKRIAGGWPKPMQLARETLEQKK